MKQKVSLPIAVAIALIAAALAFSLAYIIATNSMNKKLTDLGEKQSMFSTLSEADRFCREKSFFDVDEEILTTELCRAYAKAYEVDVKKTKVKDINLGIETITNNYLDDAVQAIIKKLSLTRDITTVTLCSHILSDSLHSLTSDDLSSYRCLDGNIELLAWDKLLKLLTHLTTEVISMISMNQ